MNERLKKLYKTQILANARDETHYHELTGATHKLEAYNPMCGDQYTLYLKIEEGTIVSASFQGYGCAISKASTAVLSKRIIGKNLSEIDAMVREFLELIDPESETLIEAFGVDDELLSFAGTREYPERKQCASLSWDELSVFLSGNTEV